MNSEWKTSEYMSRFGEQLREKNKETFSRNLKTTLLLIFLLPIGLVYMFKKSGWSRRARNTASVTALSFIGLFIFAVINAPPAVEVANLRSTEVTKVDGETMEVKGKISPASASLLINGEEFKSNENGDFVARIKLKEGASDVTVKAIKENDKHVEETYSVRRATQAELEEKERKQKEKEAEAARKAEQERLDNERKAAEEAERAKAQKRAEEMERRRNYWHKVTGVDSGDTIRAAIDGREQVIRIAGLDAPSGSQCFGSQSSAKVREFLTNKWIQLEQDEAIGERDRAGNILAYVWFDDGTDLGRRLIEEGYANASTSLYIKNVQYQETQAYSKSKSYGLWSDSTCKGQRTLTSTAAATSPKTTQSAPANPRQTPSTQPNNTPSATAPTPAANTGKNYQSPRPQRGVVKKSVLGGVCYAPGSAAYDMTRIYRSFDSVESCLASGGRMPWR